MEFRCLLNILNGVRGAMKETPRLRKVVTSSLKVPKFEIFDGSDFPDFYTIKSSWVGYLGAKILTYYFNF